MYAPTGWQAGFFHLCLKYPIIVLISVGISLAGFGGLPFGYGFWWTHSETCDPNSMVTITFDDGYKSVYENAFPLMEKYGYKGTAYVITGFIEDSSQKYMSWKDLVFLQDNGWEIGSHTVTHPDLLTLMEEELCKELFVSKQDLEDHGLIALSFASPFGKYDLRVIGCIAKYYYSHRTSWPIGLNNIPLEFENRYELKSVCVDEITVQEVKEWILKAKAENKWLILDFHRIGEEGEYSTSLEDFETILSFLKENEFSQFPLNFIFSNSSSEKE